MMSELGSTTTTISSRSIFGSSSSSVSTTTTTMISAASSQNRDGPSSSPNDSPTFHNQTMSTTTIMELLINILTIMSFLFVAAPTLTSLQFEPIINHPCTTIIEPTPQDMLAFL